MHDKLNDSVIDDTIKIDCFRDHIMMACKQTSTTNLEVLAWASRDEVFKVTDVPDCGTNGEVNWERKYEQVDQDCSEGLSNVGVIDWNCKTHTKFAQETASCGAGKCQRDNCDLDNGLYPDQCYVCTCNDGGTCTGNTVNGVKWYRVEGESGTWGFAYQDSTINLNWVDVASGNNDDKRLSLHVNDNAGGYEGGHRCGMTKASNGQRMGAGEEWELVFYHTDVVP